MKKFVFAGAAVAALLSTAAAAQDGQRGGEPLTRDAVASRVEAAFARLDVNRDNILTQDEVRAQAEARRSQRGERREQRQADRGDRRADQFARLDANRDGSISRSEFESRPALDRQQRSERREARGERRGQRDGGGGGLFARLGGRQFQAADANGDGRLTRQEARRGALMLFDRVDTDRDGTISQEERRAAREAFGGQRQQRRQS